MTTYQRQHHIKVLHVQMSNFLNVYFKHSEQALEASERHLLSQ